MTNNDCSDNQESICAGEIDGIHMTDRPLPPFWKWCFLLTVVIAPPYFFYYHGGAVGRTLGEQLDARMAENLRIQMEELGELPQTRESVVKYLYDESWIKLGKSVFKSNCVSCHAKDGGGLVGPNLCDDEYKHVSDIEDVLRVIQNGANGGAMPAWNGKLSPNELVLVSSYVASLRGTVPGAPKAAEGRKIDAWPGPPPTAK